VALQPSPERVLVRQASKTLAMSRERR